MDSDQFPQSPTSPLDLPTIPDLSASTSAPSSTALAQLPHLHTQSPVTSDPNAQFSLGVVPFSDDKNGGSSGGSTGRSCDPIPIVIPMIPSVQLVADMEPHTVKRGYNFGGETAIQISIGSWQRSCRISLPLTY